MKEEIATEISVQEITVIAHPKGTTVNVSQTIGMPKDKYVICAMITMDMIVREITWMEKSIGAMINRIFTGSLTKIDFK